MKKSVSLLITALILCTTMSLPAFAAEESAPGNLQNYICDVDNHKRMELAVVSNYFDTSEDEETDETALKIIKLEEGTEMPLEGAVFSVYDPLGRKLGSWSTGYDGTVTIPLTLEGHYTVAEEIPPEYHFLMSPIIPSNLYFGHSPADVISFAATFFKSHLSHLRAKRRRFAALALRNARLRAGVILSRLLSKPQPLRWVAVWFFLILKVTASKVFGTATFLTVSKGPRRRRGPFHCILYLTVLTLSA